MSQSIMISWAFSESIAELIVAMTPCMKSFLTMSAPLTPVAADRSLIENGAAMVTLPPILAGVWPALALERIWF